MVFQQEDPSRLPWKKLGVEVVIESTVSLIARKKRLAHIDAGAKKVILTAPGKNEDVTLVYGVNHTHTNRNSIGLSPMLLVLPTAWLLWPK